MPAELFFLFRNDDYDDNYNNDNDYAYGYVENDRLRPTATVFGLWLCFFFCVLRYVFSKNWYCSLHFLLIGFSSDLSGGKGKEIPWQFPALFEVGGKLKDILRLLVIRRKPCIDSSFSFVFRRQSQLLKHKYFSLSNVIFGKAIISIQYEISEPD